MKLNLAVGLCFATLFASGSVASAQSSVGSLNITTMPLPVSLTVKPGQVASTKLRVKNNGVSIESLSVGLMKFAAYGEEGKPALQDREAKDDYFDWVTFSRKQLEISPGEWGEVDMSIAVPATAAFGYYYAVTFTRANSSSSKPDQSTKVNGGTATLVLVDVDSGGAKRSLELVQFGVDKRVYEFLPASFYVRLKNTGNIHVVPTGTIYISKGGEQLAAVPLNQTSGNVLPGSVRRFVVEWDNGFPHYVTRESNGAAELKDGKQSRELNWDISNLKNLRFGHYSAHITAVYFDGTRDVPIDGEVSFWVVPWRILIVGLILPLVIVGFIIYLVVSRRKFKKMAEARISNLTDSTVVDLGLPKESTDHVSILDLATEIPASQEPPSAADDKSTSSDRKATKKP